MAGVPTLVTDSGYELTVVDLDPLRAAICAVGEFDLAAQHDLTRVLRQQEEADRRFVQLDLSQATLLDCSCLRVLVTAHHRFLDRRGLLVLTGVDGCVARILEVSGLDDLLFIVPTDEDPFGSVLMARAARRGEAQRERSSRLPTAAIPVAIPVQYDPGSPPPRTHRKAAS